MKIKINDRRAVQHFELSTFGSARTWHKITPPISNPVHMPALGVRAGARA
jgi:hypothetical protein